MKKPISISKDNECRQQPIGLLQFDRKGKVIWQNDNLDRLLTPKDKSELISALLDDNPENAQFKFMSCDNEIICHCEKAGPSYLAVLFELREITAVSEKDHELKKLEHEYQTVIDSIDDGIFVIDHQGFVIRLNDAARGERRFEDYIGVNVRDDIACGHISHSVSETIIKNGLQEKVHRIIRYKDRKDMLSTGTPYYENGVLKFIVAHERNFEDLEQLKKKLMKAIDYEDVYIKKKKEHRIKGLKGNVFVTNSEKMLKLIDITKKMGAVDSTILLVGESGVGKEVIADLLYLNSVRKEKPFVKANCGAIPETLWESELFGYETGSFTGASKKGKKGYFDLANGGTLLLDEISEIPIAYQAKLLRVLQEKEIYRIGGEQPIPLNVRIIAATNKNLSKEVEAGNFRMDLYHRLNIIELNIPPLRERKVDIKYLASYFLERLNKKYHTKKKITVPAIKLLENYDWPGNIRELKNMIERLVVITSTDTVGYYDVFQQVNNIEGSDFFYKDEDMNAKEALKLFKKELLSKLMKRYNNNTRKVAEELSVSRSTVNRMLKNLGVR